MDIEEQAIAALPCLYEMVLLGVGAVALQTLGKIIVALPSCRPLVHSHDFKAVTYRRVDLDRVSLHDLAPLDPVNFGFWRFVNLGLDRSAQILVVQHIVRQSRRSL